MEEILEIKQKTFVLLLIKHQYFFGTLGRRSVNRIKEVRIRCHSNNCSMATKILMSPVSFTASVN